MTHLPLEYLAIFIGGLLGSAHCVGMCGGFAVSLGLVGKSWRLNLGRQLLYGLGRVFTYTVGGVLAGYAGCRLAALLPEVTQAQALLCLVAGTLLVVEGLSAAGLLGMSKSAGEESCLSGGMFGTLLRATRLHSVFLGGVVNGLLPCGLVYAFLALAGSSRQPIEGGLVMLLFGLGTLPVLALVGVGAGQLRVGLRRKLLTLAAWCVVLTGAISLYRGYAFYQSSSEVACPLCATTR
jgi:sulfite exporter TauE/SafE